MSNEQIKTISIPTIKGWFDVPNRVVKSGKGKRFLYNYLQWIGSLKPLKGEQKARFELVEQYLRRFAGMPDDDQVNITVNKRDVKLPKGAMSKRGKAERSSSADRIESRDQSNLDRLRPIAGTYQVIRPLTSRPGEYALETLAIDTTASTPQELLLMFSHTQPRLKHIYKGELSINNKYCFGFAHREHEDDYTLRTSRSVAMFISEPGHCISGIMLRGVSALHTARMAIATPFVAIRSPYAIDILRTSEFKRATPEFYMLQNDLLVGKVEKGVEAVKPILAYCDHIFEAIKGQLLNSNSLVLQTVESKDISRIIDSRATSEDAYFLKWRTAVTGYLHADSLRPSAEILRPSSAGD